MASGSKLPDVGTTIFTVISRRAEELGAVNLGQGFPDYPIDPRLTELVSRGHARRPQPVRTHGGRCPALHGRIARRAAVVAVASRVDPQREITITLGATEAIFSAIAALVGPGDEVLVFDPAYDSYDPAVRVAGARCVHVPLLPPEFRYDWDRVRAAVTDAHAARHRQHPAQPGLHRDARQKIWRSSRAWREERDLIVLSDEVYEHLVSHGDARHSQRARACRRCANARWPCIPSASRMHATGLRVGYCVAPPLLTTELRKVHQFNTFSDRHGLPARHRRLPRCRSRQCSMSCRSFFAHKRHAAHRGPGRLRIPRAAGAGHRTSRWWTTPAASCSPASTTWPPQHAVAGAGRCGRHSACAFLSRTGQHSLLRLCFAKHDETIAAPQSNACASLR